MNHRRSRNAVAILLLALVSPAVAETRWPQFRGPGGLGIADAEKPPVEFGESKNVLWKTPIPPGHSSPCIWDNHIFITAFEKGQLSTLCLRRSDGQILWRQVAPIRRLERVSGANSRATPTPATDGQRVYVLFGSFGLLAYDFAGSECWRKPLSMENVRHGTAASPVLAGGKLIVNGDQEDFKSFLLAADPVTGQTVWQTPRPLCFSSHTTPLHLQRESADEILVAGSIRLVAYDLKDGSERWSCRGLEAISICPSPIVADGIVYAMSYSMAEKLPAFADLLARIDRNNDGRITPNECTPIVRDVFSIIDANRDGAVTEQEWEQSFRVFRDADNGILAVRPGGTGDVTATHMLWTQKKGLPEVASPVGYRGRIFIVKSGGFLSCFDGKTGQPLFLEQRIGALGQYFASPVAADGRIYLASNQGVVSVIEAADALRVLARNDLSEPIIATPAIVDSKLYVRTAEHLWAFGQ